VNGLLRCLLVAAMTSLGVTACVAPRSPAAPPAGAGQDRTLIVFAAASLTEAFQQLGTQFEAAHPGATVTFNFAGSQQLAQQLGQGATADVFASANDRQMQVAVDAGRVMNGTERTFTGNRLVVIVPAPAENLVAFTSLQDLARPRTKVVLAAREVPVGAYSLEFLAKASGSPGFPPQFDQAVLANVVSYEENVKAVLSKVVLGEADAGIVYTSDAPPGVDGVERIAIPADLNITASYPIAPLMDAPQPVLAQAFVDYVMSPEGQAVLAAHGFAHPWE
jgi:molybdate transport system substrate-binding protein